MYHPNKYHPDYGADKYHPHSVHESQPLNPPCQKWHQSCHISCLAMKQIWTHHGVSHSWLLANMVSIMAALKQVMQLTHLFSSRIPDGLARRENMSPTWWINIHYFGIYVWLMTPCRTEKVDFSKKKTIKQKQKQNHQKNKSTGINTRRNKEKQKEKNCGKCRFWYIYFFFSCFFLGFGFLVCFFCLLWFFFVKPYILCVVGLIMFDLLSSQSIQWFFQDHAVRQALVLSRKDNHPLLGCCYPLWDVVAQACALSL